MDVAVQANGVPGGALPDEPEIPFFKIRPSSRWAPLNLGELWHFRELLSSLAGRDVRLRYRQTFLGAAWVILQPLMAAGIFSLVFGRVAKMPSDGVPYFLFSYAGLLGWNVFSNTLNRTSTCLLNNAHLVSKIYFPRLLLPLSTVGSVLIDFGVAFVMMIVLLITYHVGLGWGVLLLPLWLLLILLIALGAGLYASALMVTYRDVQHVLPVFTQFLLYASPIAYGLSLVPANLRFAYLVNPLSGLMEAVRWSLLGTGSLNKGALAYSAGFAVASFLLGVVTFRRMERRFADVI